MWHYRTKIKRVIDADTLEVILDLGFYIQHEATLRLYGINAWETRGEEREKGLKAKEYLIERLKDGTPSIETIKDKKGKYGRYLAVLWLNVGTEEHPVWLNLNRELIDKGHGREYLL